MQVILDLTVNRLEGGSRRRFRLHAERCLRRGMRSFAILAGVLLEACTSAPKGDPAKQPVFLVSPQEALALQAALRNEIRQLKARRCERPVLRGPAVAGRPDPLVISLVKARGPHRACATLAGQRSAALQRLLFRGGALPGEVKSPGPIPDLADLRRVCADVPQVLSKAVRFTQACSPYRPGLRPLPGFVTTVRLQQAAAALAVLQADRAPAEAGWRLLEILRFGQDLERGTTPWIWTYVMRSAWRPVVASLGRLFASGRLRPKQRRALDRGLRVLLASEPDLARHVQGERLHVEWTTFFVPWARRVSQAVHRSPVQAEQGHLLAWMAYRTAALRYERACPPGSAPRRCLPRFRALARQEQAAARDLKEQWAWFEQWLASGQVRGKDGAFDRRAARRAALAVLAGRQGTRHHQHLLRAAQRGFYLTALRLHLAVLRAQEAQAAPLVLSQVEALARDLPEPFAAAPLEMAGLPGQVILRPPIPLAPAGEPPVRYIMRWKVPRPARP